MIINKIPFEIDFPLKILKNQKVNFEKKKEREKIFRRHIYYYKYGKTKNFFLEKRNKIFFSLAKEVTKYIKKVHPNLDILNISIFGSSLHSKNFGDFDFLVITRGNVFRYDETELIITKNEKKMKYPVGVSIKGIENFSKGVFDEISNIPLDHQRPIIYRTAISLFRRHIPIIGYDFVNNKASFLKNGYAQVSDLLNNAYELYYLKNEKSNRSNRERSRKILSRLYEAISYTLFLENDAQTNNFKKKIAIQKEKGVTLNESRKIFDHFILFYQKKTEYLK